MRLFDQYDRWSSKLSTIANKLKSSRNNTELLDQFIEKFESLPTESEIMYVYMDNINEDLALELNETDDFSSVQDRYITGIKREHGRVDSKRLSYLEDVYKDNKPKNWLEFLALYNIKSY